MTCIDSDVLIDFLNKEKNAISKIQSLKKDGEELSITSINSFEIFKGFMGLDNKEKFEKAVNFLTAFRILDFKFESSSKAAEIFYDLKTRGEIIELPDIMISAICIANNETLLTKNKRHFERIKELELETF